MTFPSETFPSDALTRDAFLGGRVQAWQPKDGAYRAGVDAVLLAAACPADPGASVLELGCGVGVASLCLAARVPEVTLAGLELQSDLAEVARRNAAENAAPLTVHQGDLAAMPPDLRDQSFDHVIANPPYFDRTQGTAALGRGREMSRGENTPIATWLHAARRRLRPKGWLTLIQQTQRLPDILEGLGGFGSIAVLPLCPREGRPAKLVILRARKLGGAPFTVLSPKILHSGSQHQADGDSYTPEISSVLRDGTALPGF